MNRLYGRAPRGKRLLGTAPFGCWKTTPFIAGLRHDRIVAPVVLDGPINGRAFTAWHPGSRKATRSSLIISAATRSRGCAMRFGEPSAHHSTATAQPNANTTSTTADTDTLREMALKMVGRYAAVSAAALHNAICPIGAQIKSDSAGKQGFIWPEISRPSFLKAFETKGILVVVGGLEPPTPAL